MAQTFDVYPSGDIDNDGWTLVASTYTHVWEILSAVDDSCHIRCPSYRGGAEVSFPIDTSSLPAGAVIDSVTVYVRMQTNAGSGPRSVTCNVLSSENRSRYTTRTVYATSSINTYTVATYTKDPLGNTWDVHRLNRLRCRLFSYNNLFDSCRIYGLWCRVNYHVKPTVIVNTPSGTVGTPSPTVSWSYAQLEGEPQKNADYKIFTAAQASVNGFSPDTASPVYSTTVQGSANSYTLPTSLNNDSYKIYVRATSQFGSRSDWASKQFTIVAPSPGVPGDNNAGVSGIPGIGTPTVIPDNYTSSAAIRMTDTSNLLSVQAADFEIASDPIPYTPTNATLARDTTLAYSSAGIASMKMTASSAATMSAKTYMQELAPGMPLTARAQFLAQATGRTVNLKVNFFDEDFNALSGTITGTGTDATSTWTEVVVTGDSPASTKYAQVVTEVVSPASSEKHNVDHVGLMYGYNTAWSDGGHASRNLLTAFLSTGDDPASATDAWVTANAATTLSRVTATGTGANGLKCNQMTCASVSPSIAFRATSSVFTTATAGTNYTLNKPVGTADNDLLIAFVTSTEFGTITPPVGWTAVNTATIDDGTGDVSLWVLKRTGLASDPSTWTTGTVSASSARRTAVVVAYAGAANASSQFIADGVRTEGNEPLVMQTASILNTDPNAWRVAAFAASDDHTGMTMTANVSPPTLGTASISYVGKATAWSTTSDTFSYTLNKPTGTASGDLMLASALFSGNTTSVVAPSGWTTVRTIHSASTGSGDWHSGDTTMVIFKRTAGASEPSSWNGSHGDWGRPKITQVVAYRNADTAANQFVTEGSGTRANNSSVSTGTVYNTDSRAWRVSMFGATTSYGDSWSGGDNSERSDNTTNMSDFPDTVLQISDSNGTVGTGNHSRTAYIDGGSFFAAAGWIGIIKPLSSAPAAGANETERVDNQNGSANPWLCTAVYDSNATVPSGATSVYGTLTTGDGLGASSMASWVGMIRPASSITGGTVASYPNTTIDLAAVDPAVFDLAGNKMTIIADFLGSSSGTPTLTVDFYRANQLISSKTAVGQAFNSSLWNTSWAVFDIPDGTTRVRPTLGALDRAAGDTVQFDRVGLMFGSEPDPTQEPHWRNGTARPEHPVWSKPIIQYQENDGTGYGDWSLVPGQTARPPAYGLQDGTMFYVDHTIVPLNSRRYRVSTLSYGLNGDIFSSGYGPASEEAVFEPRAWWLKDITNLDNNIQITPKWDDMAVETGNTATAFQPLGEDYPIVVTEGFKADQFDMQIHCEQDEFTALMKLLRTGRTLVLQSDIDRMWWVRPVGNVTATILATAGRQDRPQRYVKVTWAQVSPEV